MTRPSASTTSSPSTSSRAPIGERAGAARIGRQIAPDGAAAFGAERQRKQASGGGGGFLRARQDDARLAGHGVRGGVDLADAVEPLERQHDLAVERGLAADQAGIAALRHDRGPGLVGQTPLNGEIVLTLKRLDR